MYYIVKLAKINPEIKIFAEKIHKFHLDELHFWQ